LVHSQLSYRQHFSIIAYKLLGLFSVGQSQWITKCNYRVAERQSTFSQLLQANLLVLCSQLLVIKLLVYSSWFIFNKNEMLTVNISQFLHINFIYGNIFSFSSHLLPGFFSVFIIKGITSHNCSSLHYWKHFLSFFSFTSWFLLSWDNLRYYQS
jgi:hypothetical protein